MKDFVRNHFQREMDDNEVGGFYRFCLVHFKRSLARVANINDLVPMEKVTDFKERVLGLLDIPIGCCDRFHEMVETLMEDFPRTKKWMNWYLQKDRCKILFPALKQMTDQDLKRWDLLLDNTNPEENFHRQFCHLMKS